MAPTTPRKRAKALLKELWELQVHDIPMTAATLIEVKYLLRNYRHSTCVDVHTPKPRANILDPVPFSIAEGAAPKFILCQLLDQKLIDSRNYQDTIALPAVLSVINQAFSLQPSTRRLSFPTQFRWHCSRTHRTHIIFAYLDLKMKSKVYGVEELLNLRSSASPDILATVLLRDNDLSEMLRNKSRVSSRSYSVNSLKRGPKRTMDDSSTTSDEVVFKGTINRRQLKSESAQIMPPISGSQNIRPTVESIDGILPIQPGKSAPVSTTQASTRTAPAAELEQPMEWKYRGRSGSEITASEPLPAPTGLDAQHHEGFQRFYKAVVSPTHVRVTAGGRIVPNTRNPVSPTTRRPKDEESVVNGDQSETASAPPQKQPAIPMMGMPHPMPFFYPGFPGMPPIHPMTGMPIPMMPPGFPFPMPMPPAAAAKEAQFRNADDKDSKRGPDPETTKTAVKISPPEQFDHTKPFVFNGQQWMFPMFPAPYSGFMGMPPPGYVGPHVPGAPMMMPPMGPMMGPIGMQPNQVNTQSVSSMPASSRQSTPNPPPKPPISSIRPSQISRKQIDGLRANLKYHDDQLHFNKHQIDEKDMLNKIQMLKADIERFERVHQCQIEYEEKHYPRTDQMKEEGSSASGRSSAPSTKTSQSQSEESKESKATSATTTSQPKLRKKERSRDSVGLNSNKSSNASYSFEEATRDRLLGAMGAGMKSTLPSGAAMAPIFQPRMTSAPSVPMPNGQTQPWQSAATDEVVSQEQLEAVEARLVAAGTKAWGLGQQPKEISRSTTQSQSPEHNGNLGVPYLIGTLPRGGNPYSTQRIEYDYSRQLTNEERQARYLYWGKASRSVRQGLPKYDGKNFYPASPVKNNESPDALQARAQNGERESEYGFSASVNRGTDPFQATTPSQTFSAVQGTIVTSESPSARSIQSFNSQVENHAEEFERALAETESISEESRGTHSKGVSETKSADYQDPRANGASSKLWQSMLKRGLTNSDVLPSTVSSTTAHGFLPQFAGNAAASLSPSISGAQGSPSRASPSKTSTPSKDNEVIIGGASTFMTQKTAKNCPPAAGERLSETLLNMVGMKAPAWAN